MTLHEDIIPFRNPNSAEVGPQQKIPHELAIEKALGNVIPLAGENPDTNVDVLTESDIAEADVDTGHPDGICH